MTTTRSCASGSFEKPAHDGTLGKTSIHGAKGRQPGMHVLLLYSHQNHLMHASCVLTALRVSLMPFFLATAALPSLASLQGGKSVALMMLTLAVQQGLSRHWLNPASYA